MFEIRMLGPLEVVIGGRQIVVGSPRQRAILALLCLNAGSVVSAQRIEDELWGEQHPPASHNAVQVHVSRLRKALCGATITARPPGYVLDSTDLTVDARVFEALVSEGRALAQAGDAAASSDKLREALRLWRGPALGDIPLLSCEQEAARLEECRLAAVEDRIDADLACGRHANVAAELEFLTGTHPYRERMWGQRMLALYRAGRQADAIAAFDEVRTRLVDDLGVDPSPELVRLHGSVLQQDPRLEVHTGAATRAPAAAAPALPGGLLPSEQVFVGRETEMSVLVRAFEDAARGKRRAVLLAGEPGIGKTRLAAELAAHAHERGGLVLYGRCDDRMAVPYQPFVEALTHYVTGGGTARPLGRHSGDLVRLAPHVTGSVGPPVRADGDAERYRLFEAVTSWLETAAEVAPVVLVIDDIHWAPTPTLLMLRHVVRSTPTASIMVVATYRDTELHADHPLSWILPDLRRTDELGELHLGSLDVDAVDAFLHRTVDVDAASDADVARTLHDTTGGNPLFMRELLSHLDESGRSYSDLGEWSQALPLETMGLPPRVRDVVGQRAARLSDDARELLAVAAVAGDRWPLMLVERAWRPTDRDRVLDAVEEALGAGLVVERDGQLGFAHALIRQALYGDLSPPRRTRLHQRIAEALEALPDAGGRLGELAHHYAMTAHEGGAAKAATYALRAAERSVYRLAFEEAVAILERALDAVAAGVDDGLRADLLIGIADARFASGDIGGARNAALPAGRLARQLRSGERLARAVLAYDAGAVAPQPDSIAMATEALGLLGDDEPSLRSRLLSHLASAKIIDRDTENGIVLAEEAIGLARSASDNEGLAIALEVRFRASFGSPRIAERIDLWNEIVAHSPPIGYPLAGVLLQAGERQRFEEALASYEKLAERHAGWNPGAFVCSYRLLLAILDGRLADADELLSELGAVVSRLGSDSLFIVYAGQLYWLRREQGRLDEIESLAQDMLDRGPPVYAFRAGLAVTKAELGKLAEAGALLAHVDQLETETLAGDPSGVLALALFAETCGAVGDAHRAARVETMLAPHSGQLVLADWGVCSAGAVDRALAILATTQGRFDDAEKLFDAAVALEERLRAPVLLARTRLWEARMLIARGEPGDEDRAGDRLRRAAEISRPARMTAVEAAASAQLRTASRTGG